MAATDTIKEFLVGLGFNVDTDGLKRFVGGVESATKAVTGFGVAGLAAATAIEAMVTKTSNQMESLYYASQRIGASTDGIRSFQYAAEQVGISSSTAMGEIEGLGMRLRMMPGLINQLQGAGANMFDSTGKALETQERVFNVIDMLKRRYGTEGPGLMIASSMAQMYGMNISPQELLQQELHLDEERAKYQKRRAEINKAHAGTDPDSQAYHQFSNDVRDLDTAFGDLEKRIADDFLPIADEVVKDVTALVRWFIEADKATAGWNLSMVGLDGALGKIPLSIGAIGTAIVTLFSGKVAAKFLGRILGFSAAEKVAAAAAGAGAAGAGAAGASTAAAAGAGEAAAMARVAARVAATGAAEGSALGVVSALAAPLTAAYVALKPTRLGDEEDTPEAKAWLASHQREKFDRVSRLKQAFSYYVSRGWSKEQASGIVANIQAESGFDAAASGDNGKAFGLFQWHKDRQNAFQKLFGHNIADSTFDEQLQFADYEMRSGGEQTAGADLAKANSAGAAAKIVSLEYERPAAGAAAAAQRADMADRIFADNMFNAPLAPSPMQLGQSQNVTLNQKTDINIVGGPTAQATADKVKLAQDAVWPNAVRNLANNVIGPPAAAGGTP
jgi:hypothetical protein